jgi:hypothetical protein
MTSQTPSFPKLIAFFLGTTSKQFEQTLLFQVPRVAFLPLKFFQRKHFNVAF